MLPCEANTLSLLLKVLDCDSSPSLLPFETLVVTYGSVALRNRLAVATVLQHLLHQRKVAQLTMVVAIVP